MRTRFVVCGTLSVVSAAVGAHAPATQITDKCAALQKLQVPGVALTIAKAEWHAAGPIAATPGGPPLPLITLPPYCQVDGTIDHRDAGAGKSFGIGFSLALPDDWNGRFLMQGGGGLNGRAALPIGPTAAGDKPALTRGFAVVTTDSGHQSSAVFDASFMQDQQAALDFAYAAVGRVAVLAKEIVSRYYARAAARSYFAGCSTGGREAMLMAQRYPTYFDGIIAGAPAMRTGHSNLALRSIAVTFNRIAPRDASGKPIANQAFSESDRKTVVDGLLAACDANDGLKDGMIFDVRGCRFDPARLVCKGPKADGCLSPEQASAIVKAFTGPKDSRGNQVYPGFFYDTGIAASGAGIPGILLGAGPPVPPPAGLDQDIDREARIADTDPQAILTDTASWTNLSTFASHGGKVIFFHGVSDPWFSAQDTIDYYEAAGRAAGGFEREQAWARLFLSPGMGHCGGGASALDRFDLLTAVVDWVEQGAAPTAVTATGRAFPGRSRPLCAYPQYAHYKGQGDPEDARNFECRN